MNKFKSDRFKKEMPEAFNSFLAEELKKYTKRFFKFMVEDNPDAIGKVHDLIHEQIDEYNLDTPDEVFIAMIEMAMLTINKSMSDFVIHFDNDIKRRIKDGSMRAYSTHIMEKAKEHHADGCNECKDH